MGATDVIATTVCLGNVRDIEGLVAHTIRRSRIRLSREEHEELLAEGIAIVCDLWSRFVPHRDGYEHAGTFSGYVGSLLPKRLDDAYHKLHPEHRASRDEGVRFEYGQAPMSLFGESVGEIVATGAWERLGPSEYDNLPRHPGASMVASIPYEMPPFMASSCAHLPISQRGRAKAMVGHMARGLGIDEIAGLMRMDRGDVSELRATVEKVARMQLIAQPDEAVGIVLVPKSDRRGVK